MEVRVPSILHIVKVGRIEQFAEVTERPWVVAVFDPVVLVVETVLFEVFNKNEEHLGYILYSPEFKLCVDKSNAKEIESFHKFVSDAFTIRNHMQIALFSGYDAADRALTLHNVNGYQEPTFWKLVD